MANRRGQLTDFDQRQLLRIAELVEAEAQSWREGFAVYRGHGVYDWSTTHEKWAHVRCAKLEISRDFLRRLAGKPTLTPQEQEALAVAAGT